MFRVYHEGALQGSTLGTSYTVGGLQSCHQYQSKVEALCGDSVVLSVHTITAHTGNVDAQENTGNKSGHCCSEAQWLCADGYRTSDKRKLDLMLFHVSTQDDLGAEGRDH